MQDQPHAESIYETTAAFYQQSLKPVPMWLCLVMFALSALTCSELNTEIRTDNAHDHYHLKDIAAVISWAVGVLISVPTTMLLVREKLRRYPIIHIDKIGISFQRESSAKSYEWNNLTWFVSDGRFKGGPRSMAQPISWTLPARRRIGLPAVDRYRVNHLVELLDACRAEALGIDAPTAFQSNPPEHL